MVIDRRDCDPLEKQSLYQEARNQLKELRQHFGAQMLGSVPPEDVSERLFECLQAEDKEVSLRAIRLYVKHASDWMKMAAGQEPEKDSPGSPEPISEALFEQLEGPFGPQDDESGEGDS